MKKERVYLFYVVWKKWVAIVNSTFFRSSRVCIGLHLIQIDCSYRAASGAWDNRFDSSISKHINSNVC